jgi:dinuclear metal center YbgI/SA1388 family protein
MKIAAIISFLEQQAPPSLQENYDNAGLITGNAGWECTGVLVSLDATEAVVQEAIAKKCNLVVAHHPIVFGGLKKLNGKNYVEQTVIAAIKHDIAIYAIHTNLDNVIDGVNGKMASLLGLQNIRILSPKENQLRKLYTFVPEAHAPAVRQALFEAGGGHIGNYADCSFNTEGWGTFKGLEGTEPFAGKPGELHEEKEVKIEIVFPAWLERSLVTALLEAHPYEEVAYDIIALANTHAGAGSGVVGELHGPVPETAFLKKIKAVFGTPVIRHSPLCGQPVSRVAVCGGAGSFLISKALAAGAQFYITADMKYHEFFDANNRLVLADIGHYESEQFTIDLLHELLEQKFPTFAVLKTTVNTNPVRYFAE